MIRLHSVSLWLACTCSAFAGDAKAPIPSSGDWEFSLSTGPAWRHSGTLGFSGGSRSAGLSLPSFVGNNMLITPPIGSEGSYGLRTYDDGFVGTDSSTGIDGLTSHWGYQNPGQVDPAADLITFHATGFRSIRTDDRQLFPGPLESEREQSIIPVLQFNARYKHEISGMRPGFTALLAWSPVEFESQWSDFSLGQTRDDYRHDWTDRYNLGGLGAFVPSAPYTGGANTPGFLLGNLPDFRELNPVLIGTEDALITNRVFTRFDADHTTFSFGPTISHRVNPEWNVEAGVGISLSWLRWSASQNEKLSVLQNGKRTLLREWKDSSSGNELLTGVYLQIAVDWTPAKYDWALKGLLRADIGETFSQDIGPSTITYETDGFTAAVMLTTPF